MEKHEKQWKHCKKTFIAKRSDAQFCSSTCRHKSWEERKILGKSENNEDINVYSNVYITPFINDEKYNHADKRFKILDDKSHMKLNKQWDDYEIKNFSGEREVDCYICNEPVEFEEKVDLYLNILLCDKCMHIYSR